MSTSDKRTDGGAGVPAQMRIRLKYVDIPSFIEKFATNISRGGIFIASRTPKPVGTLLRFELLLADGKSKLLKGEGVVTWVREYDEGQPNRPHGMGVKFNRLDADSRSLIDKIEAYKRERGVRHDDAVPAPPEGAPAMLGKDSVPVLKVESVPVPKAEPEEVAASPSPSPSPSPSLPEATRPRLDTVPRIRAEAFAARLAALPAPPTASLDIEALLGVDGPALDATLVRARAVARRLTTAGDMSDELERLLVPEPAPQVELPPRPLRRHDTAQGLGDLVRPAPASLSPPPLAPPPPAPEPPPPPAPPPPPPPVRKVSAPMPAVGLDRDAVPQAIPHHARVEATPPLPIGEAVPQAIPDHLAPPSRGIPAPPPIDLGPAHEPEHEHGFGEAEKTRSDVVAVPQHEDSAPTFVAPSTDTSSAYYDSVERTEEPLLSQRFVSNQTPPGGMDRVPDEVDALAAALDVAIAGPDEDTQVARPPEEPPATPAAATGTAADGPPLEPASGSPKRGFFSKLFKK